MRVKCECGNDTFPQPKHSYYEGVYKFNCPDCNESLQVYEKEQH